MSYLVQAPNTWHHWHCTGSKVRTLAWHYSTDHPKLWYLNILGRKDSWWNTYGSKWTDSLEFLIAKKHLCLVSMNVHVFAVWQWVSCSSEYFEFDICIYCQMVAAWSSKPQNRKQTELNSHVTNRPWSSPCRQRVQPVFCWWRKFDVI